MCYVALIPVAIAAVAAIKGSNDRAAQGEYQAKVQANNAKVAEWQAEDADARGDAAAATVRRKYAALEGSQVASFASRGIDISDGSPNSILMDTSYFGDLDQRTTKANAAREAWGYRVQGGNFNASAQFLQRGADAENPLLSGVLAGGSAYFAGGGGTGTTSSGFASSGNSLLSSGTSVSPKWYGGVNGSAGSGSMSVYG